jgi:hypothetical protein
MHSAQVHNEGEATGIAKLPTEVLQDAFSYLCPTDLHKCQLVCHYWKDCIPGDSPELKEALFIKSKRVLEVTDKYSPHLHILLDIVRRENAPSRLTAYISLGVRCNSAVYIESHPLIRLFSFTAHANRPLFSVRYPYPLPLYKQYILEASFFSLEELAKKVEVEATRLDSTWMDNLISVPAPEELRVRIHPVCSSIYESWNPSRDLASEWRAVKREGGLRMRDIVRMLSDYLGDQNWVQSALLLGIPERTSSGPMIYPATIAL